MCVVVVFFMHDRKVTLEEREQHRGRVLDVILRCRSFHKGIRNRERVLFRTERCITKENSHDLPFIEKLFTL